MGSPDSEHSLVGYALSWNSWHLLIHYQVSMPLY